MLQLDENFLQEVGLGDLPPAHKKSLLQHIYSELEQRVGMRLAEGLDESQLLQFEEITGQDTEKVQAWLNGHVPGFQQSEDFKKFTQSIDGQPDDPAVQAEYAASKWLEQNRPDYRQVVAAVFDEIKKEIAENREKILGQVA